MPSIFNNLVNMREFGLNDGEECQGDCDYDWDCQGRLICANKAGNVNDQKAPGCSIGNNNVYNVCIDPYKMQKPLKAYGGTPAQVSNGELLNECEGDCDDDEDCNGHLKCFQKQHWEQTPGCFSNRNTGAGTYSDYDYCYDPIRFPYGTYKESVPLKDDRTYTVLQKCQGDCYSDSDCDGNLRCWKTGKYDIKTDHQLYQMEVPGCSTYKLENNDMSSHQYSNVNPPASDLNRHGTSKLDKCEGDCDTGQCVDGLICHERSFLEKTPGCNMDGVSDGWDLCYDPKERGGYCYDPDEYGEANYVGDGSPISLGEKLCRDIALKKNYLFNWGSSTSEYAPYGCSQFTADWYTTGVWEKIVYWNTNRAGSTCSASEISRVSKLEDCFPDATKYGDFKTHETKSLILAKEECKLQCMLSPGCTGFGFQESEFICRLSTELNMRDGVLPMHPLESRREIEHWKRYTMTDRSFWSNEANAEYDNCQMDKENYEIASASKYWAASEECNGNDACKSFTFSFNAPQIDRPGTREDIYGYSGYYGQWFEFAAKLYSKSCTYKPADPARENRCPDSHPHVFNFGKKCCSANTRKVDLFFRASTCTAEEIACPTSYCLPPKEDREAEMCPKHKPWAYNNGKNCCGRPFKDPPGNEGIPYRLDFTSTSCSYASKHGVYPADDVPQYTYTYNHPIAYSKPFFQRVYESGPFTECITSDSVVVGDVTSTTLSDCRQLCLNRLWPPCMRYDFFIKSRITQSSLGLTSPEKYKFRDMRDVGSCELFTSPCQQGPTQEPVNDGSNDGHAYNLMPEQDPGTCTCTDGTECDQNVGQEGYEFFEPKFYQTINGEHIGIFYGDNNDQEVQQAKITNPNIRNKEIEYEFSRSGFDSCQLYLNCEFGVEPKEPNRDYFKLDIPPRWDEFPLPLCSSCQPGQLTNPDTKQCFECPMGKYTSTQQEADSKHCIDCQPGKYGPIKGLAACANCPLGYYQTNPESTDCLACESSTFQDVFGSTSCKLCPEGSFSETAAFTCIGCPTGWFYGNDKTCQKCGVGQYQDEKAKKICKNCPAGKIINAIASIECQDCLPGKYSASVGQTSCKNCLAGTFTNQAGTLVCNACPTGQYQESTGKDYCKVCDGGAPCQASGLKSACPTGHFLEPGIFADSCKKCPAEKEPTSNKKSCRDCPAGKTTYERQGTTCSACPESGWNFDGTADWIHEEPRENEVVIGEYQIDYVWSLGSSRCQACGIGPHAANGCNSGMTCVNRPALSEDLRTPICYESNSWTEAFMAPMAVCDYPWDQYFSGTHGSMNFNGVWAWLVPKSTSALVHAKNKQHFGDMKISIDSNHFTVGRAPYWIFQERYTESKISIPYKAKTPIRFVVFCRSSLRYHAGKCTTAIYGADIYKTKPSAYCLK
jgi:hypothetical protein